MEFRLTKRLAEYDITDLHAKHSEIRIEAEETYTKNVFILIKTCTVLAIILIAIVQVVDHNNKGLITVGAIVGIFIVTSIYSSYRKSYIYRKTFYIRGMIETKRSIDQMIQKRDLKTKCILDGKNVHPLVYAEVMNAPGVAKAYKELNHAKSKLEGMQEGFEILKEGFGEPLRNTSRKSKKGKKK